MYTIQQSTSHLLPLQPNCAEFNHAWNNEGFRLELGIFFEQNMLNYVMLRLSFANSILCDPGKRFDHMIPKDRPRASQFPIACQHHCCRCSPHFAINYYLQISHVPGSAFPFNNRLCLCSFVQHDLPSGRSSMHSKIGGEFLPNEV